MILGFILLTLSIMRDKASIFLEVAKSCGINDEMRLENPDVYFGTESARLIVVQLRR
jgi:hypothetical protein